MTLARILAGVGLACLASITLVHPGATRMYAMPWTIAYAVALLAPALMLLRRALDRRQRLTLPSVPWIALALGAATATLLSALFSPYRASSILWSAPLLSAIALFFVLSDWLHADVAKAEHQAARLRQLAGTILGIVAIVSLAMWGAKAARVGFREALAARNAYPLGHSNYTAGLGVLLLALGTAETLRPRSMKRRWAAAAAALLGLALVFTSGSRGGLIGIGVACIAAVWVAPWPATRKWVLAAVCTIGALGFAATNPRIRATFMSGPEHDVLASSEIQRSAMFQAGLRMGQDRSILGWGPGTTPLAYPLYRAGLDGGAENVLQLHSSPVQIWAELGLAGLACLLAFVILATRDARRDSAAMATLASYGAFAFTDWQLDVPIFAGVLAVFTALLAAPQGCHPVDDKPSAAVRRVLVGFMILSLGVLALMGRRDPTPMLNVQALAIAQDGKHHERAIALLRQSLALNPHQEIAHFNLGWLLVVSNPAEAAQHFRAAARLVPDKGGVYFGLGLAELNQGDQRGAARAFALECLNDPAFLSSPWWREPAIAATREAAAGMLDPFLARPEVARRRPRFSGAQLGIVPDGGESRYRRTRTGYPVLMRNLDLSPPMDLYDVREPAAPPRDFAVLPRKGWLPSPFLLSLLDAPTSTKP